MSKFTPTHLITFPSTERRPIAVEMEGSDLYTFEEWRGNDLAEWNIEEGVVYQNGGENSDVVLIDLSDRLSQMKAAYTSDTEFSLSESVLPDGTVILAGEDCYWSWPPDSDRFQLHT